MAFPKTAILGVGLLGASFGLALRKAGLCSHIAGYGRSRENLERAKAAGIIDSYASDPASACMDADLILIASPLGSFTDLIRKAAPAIKHGAVVTDVGSVKGSLVQEIEGMMPEGANFIGSHPIAGSDRSGMDHAKAGLFRDALCILTPTMNSDPNALKTVNDIWSSLGSKVLNMDPFEHDRIYAAVSHLPHLVAYAMVNTVSDIDSSYFSYCGQGFKDMTRIAASSPDIWTDIAIMNRENLISMLSGFRANIDRIELSLRNSDAEALKQQLIKASRTREEIGQD